MQNRNACLHPGRSIHLKRISPGIRPLFLSQKMEQKDPEKKIPSTAANAMSRSWKFPLLIQRKAQFAFLRNTIQGIDSIKQVILLFDIFNISIDEEAVGL